MYASLRIPAVSLARSILQADFKGRVIHLMAQQPTSLSTCLVLWMRIRSDHVTSTASSYTRRIRCCLTQSPHWQPGNIKQAICHMTACIMHHPYD